MTIRQIFFYDYYVWKIGHSDDLKKHNSIFFKLSPCIIRALFHSIALSFALEVIYQRQLIYTEAWRDQAQRNASNHPPADGKVLNPNPIRRRRKENINLIAMIRFITDTLEKELFQLSQSLQTIINCCCCNTTCCCWSSSASTDSTNHPMKTSGRYGHNLTF